MKRLALGIVFISGWLPAASFWFDKSWILVLGIVLLIIGTAMFTYALVKERAAGTDRMMEGSEDTNSLTKE